MLSRLMLYIKESKGWMFGRGREEGGIRNVCWIKKIVQENIFDIQVRGPVVI